jgi:hypothetical protein
MATHKEERLLEYTKKYGVESLVDPSYEQMTTEGMSEILEKTRASSNREYKIISHGRFSAGWSAPTVREAFMNKAFKDKSFKILGMQMATLKENESKVEGLKGALGSFIEGMSNFPKIILEPTFEPPPNFANVFLDEGKINLPFPMIVMINGSVREGDLNRIPHGHYNEYRYTVLEQVQDAVMIHLLVGDDPNNLPAVATVGMGVVKDNKTQVLEIKPLLPQAQMGWLNMEEIEMITWQAMTTIYMMTFHDGDVCMSVPTPREIQVNQKKIRKGKTPLVEFKLISILGKKRELPSVPHGSHASPRQHWRRGHWRSYRSGKRSWVAPMLVGDEENGKVVKDYAIGIYPEDANMHSSKLSV